MRYFIMMAFAFSAFQVYADSIPSNAINTILKNHFNKYKTTEYFSGISLSVNLPNKDIVNYVVGNDSHDPQAKPISPTTLFQIGSITKSFTSTVILQLEDEKKLSLNDTLQQWLPQYPKWSHITIKQLLNMTSGLPNYSDTPTMNFRIAQDPSHVWSNEELIALAYPPGTFTPPLKQGYFYTNTGYTLLDLIVKKITHHSLAEEFNIRIFNKTKLSHTFYPIPSMSNVNNTHLASGYNFNPYDNPKLVGKNVTDINLSWAGAAGGMVATAEDVSKWARILFTENIVLNKEQQNKLMKIVSFQTGKPIKQTTETDPFGFGLGVAQGFTPELGHFWLYEGETIGYRAFYFYVPCNKVIISAIFNSATNTDNNHGQELIKKVYENVLKQQPQLVCKS